MAEIDDFRREIEKRDRVIAALAERTDQLIDLVHAVKICPQCGTDSLKHARLYAEARRIADQWYREAGLLR